MLVDIRDKSDEYGTMYEVCIFNTVSTDLDMIHEWISENFDSYEEEIYGRWFLFESLEDAIAVKLRWS